MESPSKFDSITCKELIHGGSPKVYQLKPKSKNIGTVKRMTLGEKDANTENKTILFLGETGTGKSTLINALVNYAIGVRWEDDVWFEIVEDKQTVSQCESQTSDVIVYQIFGFEGGALPYSLTIIDTPGYGDTRRVRRDAIISQRLCDWFRSEDGIHELSALGLVLKGSENRLSDRLLYIFDSVVSLFGKDVKNNIIALITHSDGRTPRNALKALEDAKLKLAKDEKKQIIHFLFNNCQKEDRSEDFEMLKYADNTSMKGLSGCCESSPGGCRDVLMRKETSQTPTWLSKMFIGENSQASIEHCSLSEGGLEVPMVKNSGESTSIPPSYRAE